MGGIGDYLTCKFSIYYFYFMISSLIVCIGVILSVALMTLAERKVMGAMQRRIGPNKVGYLGVLQPLTIRKRVKIRLYAEKCLLKL